ncbi:MAG: MoxR family ATPase [Bifidobacteriaceae bacterium]|jgi:MoxR-like ATPase|nr:MoxR family ATPase [Bifidobacteriaceae bacterium]
MDDQKAVQFATEFAAINAAVAKVIAGKPSAICLVVTAMLAGGHALLEDVPGTGKTSLAKAVAAAVAGTHGRVQFTPDLLPSDLIGASIYNQNTGQFGFRPGPVFCSVLLADEINRASPKTQSALLEAMEERQVTADGVSHDLPAPFVVIATQNPIEQLGTYRLPEAQLDRFLIRTKLGYPSHETTVSLVRESARIDRTAVVKPVVSVERVVQLSEMAAQAHIAPAVAEYIVSVTEATRMDDRCELGASTRGGLALARCAKVFAMAQGRAYVTPDDVKALAHPVLAHRLIIGLEALVESPAQAGVAHEVIAGVLRRVTAPAAGGLETARMAA